MLQLHPGTEKSAGSVPAACPSKAAPRCRGLSSPSWKETNRIFSPYKRISPMKIAVTNFSSFSARNRRLVLLRGSAQEKSLPRGAFHQRRNLCASAGPRQPKNSSHIHKSPRPTATAPRTIRSTNYRRNRKIPIRTRRTRNLLVPRDKSKRSSAVLVESQA